MTVESFNPGTVALTESPATHAIGSIVQWAGNLSTAAEAIRMIVMTPFMPQSFWPSPRINGVAIGIRDWPTPHLQHPRETEQDYLARREICIASGAIAVCKGDEIGLTPQIALESIYVVRGKPGMYAEVMEALVASRGHEFIREELSDRICRIRTRRRDSDQWQRFEFAFERARKAGYTKQNTKYDSDPQSMLWARCRAEAARGTDPGALKGLRSIEEIEDDEGSGAPRPATRTVQRAAPQAALPVPAPAAPSPAQQSQAAPAGPPLPGDDTGPAQPPDEHGPIDERTWRSINAEFVKLGVTGPGQTERRMHVICTLAGRVISRGNELTMAEGLTVLGTLQGNGRNVVAELLASPPAREPQHAPAAQSAPAGPPLPGDDDKQADDDTDDDTTDDADDGEFDPTAQDDWGGGDA